MNDEVYVEMAKALAARIITDRPETDDRQRIVYAFRLCTTRKPTVTEIEYLRAVYRQELGRFEEDPKAAKTLIGKFELPDGKKTPEDLSQWAAWFFVSNILLNLDETITKG